MKTSMKISMVVCAMFSAAGVRADLNEISFGAIADPAASVAETSRLRAEVVEVRGVWTGEEGLVTWSLGSAWGTAGFFVYRLDAASGTETRLNDRLLPVAFYEPGAAYEMADPEAREGGEGSYRLEEVELSGEVLDLGVHAVDFGPPPPQVKAAQAARPTLLDAGEGGLGPSPLLKVLLKKEGIYGVELDAIAVGMGLALEDVQALAEAGLLNFRSQGRPVPVLYDEARGRVLFHGQPTADWYARDASYLISVGEGLALPRREPDAEEGESVFPAQVRFEEDRLPLDSVVERPEDFYYWNYIISTTNPASNRVDFAINLDGYAGDALTLKVDLQGWSKTAWQNPDHHAEFSLNGTPVGTFAFDDQNAAQAELAIPAGVASNGANTLTVRGALPAGFSYSYFVLDGLTAEYDRVLVPGEGAAQIRAGAAPAISAQAFTEPLVLALDDEGWYPTWIADENGALPAKAWAVSAWNERFAVIEAAAVPMLEPEPAAADAWFMAETNRLDYLVIAARALAPAAQELADYRAGQGLRVGVAVFEDACDLLCNGLRTPEAISELMSYAAAIWPEPPRMAVLAGNGHYDYLGALSNEVNHLPPMLLQTLDGLFAADELLADSGGDDLPEVAIGRLPARSPEELAAMIAKIKAYEADFGSAWQNQLVFAADKADAAGNFSESITRFTDLVQSPYSVAARIDLDTMAIAPARAALLAGFNDGAGFIHYSGHGTTVRLSSQGLLTATDVNAMTNARQPVVAALSCLAGHYEAPAADSLAELLMRRPQGGAVAVWASSALSLNAPATDLGETVYRSVLQEGAGRLGPALLQARRSWPGDPFTRDTFATYNLLGDPALRIAGNVETNETKSAAQVVLLGLEQTYDGTARSVAATTDPAGLAVDFTYDGLATAPTAAGSYAVVATVNDENYEGTASGTLTIGKADQTIQFPVIGDQTPADTVGLAATASSGLSVSFAVASGPATISGGTNLSFTGTGSVAVAASQSGDGNWNAAAEVIRAFDVIQPAPLFVFSRTNVNVREAGEGRFYVRLDCEPEAIIPVSVARSAGDESLTVRSGAALAFGPTNWNLWQAVTLAAAEDGDADGETASFRISAPGVADRFVEATALDDDIGANLALASGGATISGTMATKPEWLIDGVHTSSANYGYTYWTNVPPGTMTLDLKAATTVSRIRLLNWDWTYRTHQYRIEGSLNGSSWTTLVDADASEQRGWEDWTVADAPARYLRFTGVSNSANRYVCVAEWEVYGAAIPLPQAEASTDNVNVREAGEGRFYVRLDREPLGNVTVGVTPFAGDAGLTVKSGATRTFTPANWSTWQVVTLQADADADADGETATFRLAGTGLETGYLEATALDDDIGANLALASGGATISGTMATKPEWLIDGVHTSSANYGYTCWTNDPPGTMTLDLQETTTVSRIRLLNWDWGYRTHQYRIEGSLDGAEWTILVDADASEQRGWEDWAVADESARYLRFTGVSNSANRYVCIAELEVYGGEQLLMARSIRRADAKETAIGSSVPAAVEEEGPETGVATVVTGDDGPEHTNGWAAVDGDANTLWAGEAGAGGWYIAVGYEATLTVTNLAVDLAEGSLTDFRCLHSLDGVDWEEWPGEFEGQAFELNYLWLLFPDDGTAAVPRVIEIEPQE